MFRRKQTDKGKPEANQLGKAAEPNTLSWGASDAEAAADDDLELDEELDEEAEGEFDDEDDEDEDPETRARREAEFQAEIQRQAEEFGLTSDNPTAIYGPNGESVASVLEALEDMDPETAERLADAWDAIDPNERDVLDRVLQRNHRGGKHQYELSAAEDSVASWLASQKPRGDEETEVVRLVAAAARDAVDAFILDEDLDDVDYDTLAGPWLAVMESEDESEEDGEGDDAAKDAPDSSDDGEYGPNTPLLLELLERMQTLTLDELVKVEQAWKTADREDLKAAHHAVEAAVREDRDWREQVKVAQEQVVKWASARAGRQSLIPPLVDCVAALVLADILEPEDAEILYAPWADVVGEPKLPTYEDDAEE